MEAEDGRLRVGGTAQVCRVCTGVCRAQCQPTRGAESLGRSAAESEVAGGLAFPRRSGTLRGAPRSCGSRRPRQGPSIQVSVAEVTLVVIAYHFGENVCPLRIDYSLQVDDQR